MHSTFLCIEEEQKTNCVMNGEIIIKNGMKERKKVAIVFWHKMCVGE